MQKPMNTDVVQLEAAAAADPFFPQPIAAPQPRSSSALPVRLLLLVSSADNAMPHTNRAPLTSEWGTADAKPCTNQLSSEAFARPMPVAEPNLSFFSALSNLLGSQSHLYVDWSSNCSFILLNSFHPTTMALPSKRS